MAFGKAVRFIQGDNCIYIRGADETTVRDTWLPYLALDKDYSEAAIRYKDDEFIKKAAEFGKGIRILRQDSCEATLSFIISSNNNIKRIKKIIEHFCMLFGDPIIFEGRTLYTFPTSAESLRKITTESLAPVKAGFRDKYIADAAEKIVSKQIDFDRIREMSTDEARKALMTIKGVGPKVADCALLFGFEREETFPKDVWIKRVMTEVYGNDFDEKRFGSYAGIIQQWIFHYARYHSEELGIEKSQEAGI